MTHSCIPGIKEVVGDRLFLYLKPGLWVCFFLSLPTCNQFQFSFQIKECVVKVLFNKHSVICVFLSKAFQKVWGFFCYWFSFEYCLLPYNKVSHLMASLIDNCKLEAGWPRYVVLDVVRKEVQPVNPPSVSAGADGKGSVQQLDWHSCLFLEKGSYPSKSEGYANKHSCF